MDCLVWGSSKKALRRRGWMEISCSSTYILKHPGQALELRSHPYIACGDVRQLAAQAGREGESPLDGAVLLYSRALVHLCLLYVVHGDVLRHTRISGILMESWRFVADGDGTTD
jgi:hypothetical protein